jgi:adenylate kinase
MKVFVGGINGVGKTTFLNALQKQMPEVHFVDGAKSFMEWLGIPNDYESLRKIDNVTANEKNSQFLAELCQQYDNLVLGAHYLNLVNGKVLDKSLGDWPKLFDYLVFLTAPAEDIYERINKDETSRDRALFGPHIGREGAIKVLDQYNEQNRRKATELSSKFQIPYIEVENMNGKLDAAVSKFMEQVITHRM